VLIRHGHDAKLSWPIGDVFEVSGNKKRTSRIQYIVGNVEKLCEPFHVAVVLTLQNSDKAIHAAH
jgi:hypothetical protein